MLRKTYLLKREINYFIHFLKQTLKYKKSASLVKSILKFKNLKILEIMYMYISIYVYIV